jgi:hypothetical protein
MDGDADPCALGISPIESEKEHGYKGKEHSISTISLKNE